LGFGDAVRAAANRLGVSFGEVRPVALAGLIDIYLTTKAGLQQNLQSARPRRPYSREKGRKFVSRADYLT
jgi:hypothetical protein